MAATPQRMGRYRVERPLGSGAFATVWLAFDEEFQTPVAIKALADNWSRDADVHERFLSEARILRRINSHRVVRVHDIGTHEGGPYFVMDYIPGGTVADLPRGSNLPASAALRWGAEASYALEDLHRAGVLHRDAKPANLLIDSSSPTPMIKVTDLGTAKALADSSGLTVTTGTPAYMAPEQVHGASGSDQRADVYALAVVTYELLSGERPFQVDGVNSVLARRAEDLPPPLADKWQLPHEVDELLGSALSLDPAGRPSSAKEFGDRLGELADRIDQDSGRIRATLAPSPVIRFPVTPRTQSMPAPVDPSQFPLRTGEQPVVDDTAARPQPAASGQQRVPQLDQTYPHPIPGRQPYPPTRSASDWGQVAAPWSATDGHSPSASGGSAPDPVPAIPQASPGAWSANSAPDRPRSPGSSSPAHPASPYQGSQSYGPQQFGSQQLAHQESVHRAPAAVDGAGLDDAVSDTETEGSPSDWPTVLVVLAGIALFLMVTAVVYLLMS